MLDFSGAAGTEQVAGLLDSLGGMVLGGKPCAFYFDGVQAIAISAVHGERASEVIDALVSHSEFM